MRKFAGLAGWLCAVAGWAGLLALPLRGADGSGELVVVFPPWVHEERRVEALVAADLFILKKSGPLALVGFAPSSFTGRDTLREFGALLIIKQNNFSLCRPAERQARYVDPLTGFSDAL